MTSRPTRHLITAIANQILYADQPKARHAPRTPPRPAGLFLGYGTRGPVIAGTEHHVLILGPPRSGKTNRLLVPSLLRHRGPAVVTSTKSDALKATITTRQKIGTCWYWDPSGTTLPPAGVEALRWSPIVDCDTWDQAVARSHALATAARPNPNAHDAHWIERAEALLAPLLHAAALHDKTMAELLTWLHKRELTPAKALLEAADATRAANLIEGLASTDARELSGIFSTADSILAAYRTDAALSAATSTNFDPDYFAATTDTIYLVAPGAAQDLHAPLVVALLDQIRAATYRWHPNPPMLYALDEVANIAPLPDLPATLAEGGSQGLTVLACLQDLSQARARWGKAADGFLTLFTHKLILPGVADTATLKAVSILAGHIDVPVRSTSTENGGLIRPTSTTWTTRRQPRLPEDQVAGLTPGTALLLSVGRISRVAL